MIVSCHFNCNSSGCFFAAVLFCCCCCCIFLLVLPLLFVNSLSMYLFYKLSFLTRASNLVWVRMFSFHLGPRRYLMCTFTLHPDNYWRGKFSVENLYRTIVSSITWATYCCSHIKFLLMSMRDLGLTELAFSRKLLL